MGARHVGERGGAPAEPPASCFLVLISCYINHLRNYYKVNNCTNQVLLLNEKIPYFVTSISLRRISTNERPAYRASIFDTYLFLPF